MPGKIVADDPSQLLDQIREIVKEAVIEAISASSRKDDKPLTEIEAAELLGVKPQTMAVWRCKGTGPRYFRSGSNVRYDRADILAHREGQKVTR